MINIEIKLNSTDDAIQLVKLAGDLSCDINFENGRCLVDAKSILGVLGADFSKPCKLVLITDNDNPSAKEFMEKIKDKIISVEVE